MLCRRLAVAGLICLAGCHSQLVQPGTHPSRAQSLPLSTPAVATPGTAAPSDWSQVPHESANSVLGLPQTPEGEARYHTIQSGDTWTKLAAQYGQSVDQLTRANGLTSSTPLQPGQMIYIP